MFCDAQELEHVVPGLCEAQGPQIVHFPPLPHVGSRGPTKPNAHPPATHVVTRLTLCPHTQCPQALVGYAMFSAPYFLTFLQITE